MATKLRLISLLCAAALASCSLETSDNGDLDGFWQLSQIDSIGPGTSVDTRTETITWAFQYDLAQLRKKDVISAMFRFSHNGDTLTLREPRQDAREQMDPAITDTALLRPLGINSLEEKFRVLRLDASSMTLQSPTLRLHFRKY